MNKRRKRNVRRPGKQLIINSSSSLMDDILLLAQTNRQFHIARMADLRIPMRSAPTNSRHLIQADFRCRTNSGSRPAVTRMARCLVCENPPARNCQPSRIGQGRRVSTQICKIV